jgi:hypothetical protein
MKLEPMPAITASQLTLYITEGRPPSDFIMAVLQDKLVESFNRADDENSKAMLTIAYFLYQHVPLVLRGETFKVQKHITLMNRELINMNTTEEKDILEYRARYSRWKWPESVPVAEIE